MLTKFAPCLTNEWLACYLWTIQRVTLIIELLAKIKTEIDDAQYTLLIMYCCE